MINVASSLYSDPRQLRALLRSLNFTEAETEQYVRLVPTLRHASRICGSRPRWWDDYLGPPWYTCPDCKADWQPPLRAKRSTHPRRVIHDCVTPPHPDDACRPGYTCRVDRRHFHPSPQLAPHLAENSGDNEWCTPLRLT